MTSPSLADQMLALPMLIGWILVKNWRPFVADVTVFVVAMMLLVIVGWLITSLETWIGDHVSAYWQRHRSQQMWREFDKHEDDQFPADAHDGDTQILLGVSQIRPQPTPPLHRDIKRRRVYSVRIPRRRMRHTSTFDSNRRH